ncbi:MAG: Dabb family protein [Coprobacter sp.]|nr:Dabb family protein [Coprobacter sp.]
MVKHIVLFKLKETVAPAEKQAIMEQFKSGLEALKTKIPVLRHIEVGINMNPAESFDMALVTEFDNMDDLQTYATHPEHVAVTQIIKDVKEGRSCVDYVF